MSPEGVYLLMVDLTKNLFDTALCRVKEDGYAEVEVPAPDSNDTNLDHLMRWLDLLHSLQNSGSCENLPPVILVGTHADCVKNPDEKTDDLKNTLFHSARCLSQCIVATVNVDSTQAGRMPSQEDARIVSLRKKIIDIADAMPQTKIQFPLKWLQVENEVYGEAKQGAKYKTRKQFRLEIADKVCQFEVEDDFEHLLNFLHDRGTIVNHDRADNPDGLVVLDPQWLIDVLCKIVKVKQEGDEAMAIYSLRQELGEKGILRPELLDHACKTPELSNIKDSLLFIMKKFNLLCECKGEDGKPVYLVPCMLTAKAEESLISPAIQGSQPLYITFDTNYVPTGLFSRLLVLFGAWAASRTSCKQQRLFANAALFVVGESTCLTLVCNKSVIKVDIWTMNSDANPVHTTPKICSEVFSFLDESLDRLKRECHWLHLVSWKFCGQCRLCLGKVDTNTKQCFRHQKRECSSDDCAHYVSIQDFPFCCTDAKGPDLCLPLTWIQVLRQKTSQGHPASLLSTFMKERPQTMEKMAKLLDREMKAVKNWKHFSWELHVDAGVIETLKWYGDFSPTIRVFDHLEAAQPDLTVSEVKNALSAIRREDLSLLLNEVNDGDKACEAITSTLLDNFALGLDRCDRGVVGNWSKFARTLGVSKEVCQEFGNRMPENPTCRLFKYLEVTKPELTLEEVEKKLRSQSVQRINLANLLKEVIDREGDKLVKDVITPESDPLRKLSNKLNHEVPGTGNWRKLAFELGIPRENYDQFESPQGQEKPSPTIEVMNWLVKSRPDIKVSDVVEALKNIERMDVIEEIEKVTGEAVLTNEMSKQTVDESPQKELR